MCEGEREKQRNDGEKQRQKGKKKAIERNRQKVYKEGRRENQGRPLQPSAACHCTGIRDAACTSSSQRLSLRISSGFQHLAQPPALMVSQTHFTSNEFCFVNYSVTYPVFSSVRTVIDGQLKLNLSLKEIQKSIRLSNFSTSSKTS